MPPLRQTVWHRCRSGSHGRSALACSTGVKIRWMKRSPCRASTFSMRRISTRSDPRPRIMRLRGPQAFFGICLRAAIHRAAHRSRIALIETDKDRLTDQEMTDIEFDDLAARQQWFRRSHSRGRDRHGLQGRGLWRTPRPCRSARIPFAERSWSPSSNASHQEPVCNSITGAPTACAVSIWTVIRGNEQRHADAGIGQHC